MDSIWEILSNIINIFIDLVPRPIFIWPKEWGIMFFNTWQIWLLATFFLITFIVIFCIYKKNKRNLISDHKIISYLIISILFFILLFCSIYTWYFKKDNNNVITLKPWAHLYWPLASSVQKIQMQKLSINLTSQWISTLDKKNIIVKWVVFYDIKDAKLALYEYDDIHDYIHDKSLVVVKNMFIKKTLSELSADSKKLNNQLSVELNQVFSNKLFESINIEISDISEWVILKNNWNNWVIYLND